jgi:hypothetical protein
MFDTYESYEQNKNTDLNQWLHCFESVWCLRVRGQEGLRLLFADINILLEADNNLEVIRETHQLSHTSGNRMMQPVSNDGNHGFLCDYVT